MAVYNIAAESEADMAGWYSALNNVIEQQKADANSDKQSVSSMDELDQGEDGDVQGCDSSQTIKPKMPVWPLLPYSNRSGQVR